MATHSEPDRVHVTGRIHTQLDGEFGLVGRGLVARKGKGESETYFLGRAPTSNRKP
jgi:hypothetical protein